MADLELITKIYKDTFGFLSKAYWLGQEEYTDDLDNFYNIIENHSKVLIVDPPGTLVLYDEEWATPNNVDDTLDELLEDDNPDTMYISNWKDDEGNIYYTLITKDTDDSIKCVTRTLPSRSMDAVSDKIVEDNWRPIRLSISTDPANKLYIWESPAKDAFDFVEMFKSWVTQYGTSEESDAISTSSSSTPGFHDL
jgi:hypothetical protein